MHLRCPLSVRDSDMEKEDLLKKRVQELARLADLKGCVLFSDFLNLNEQNILHQTLQKFSWIKGETFGGYEGAERQIAAFIPDALSYENSYEADPEQIAYPISCIRIEPRNARFSEELSHRDILGSLMNLGIERSKMGDIAVGDHMAWLFCSSALAGTISQELTKIRHTSVSCVVCQPGDFTYEPRTQRIRGSIASVRLDALIALAFQGSRSSLMSQIEAGRVFVNGKLITTNAYTPRSGDLISVRQMGKFKYLDVCGQTKKGRCMVEIEKYI